MGKLTQIYTLGDELGFELSGGGTVSFKYGEHKEGLLGLLLKLSEELGRVPTFEDVLNCPAMPHPNTFAFYFGSFDRAAEIVEGKCRFQYWREGRKIPEVATLTEIKEELENRDKELKEEDKMKRKKWTKGEILALVIRKEEELGHFPTQADFNTDSELPSYPTIANKFGGIRELKGEVEDRKARLAARADVNSDAVEAIISIIRPKKEEIEQETEQETTMEEAPEESVAEVAEERLEEESEEELVSVEEVSEEDEQETVSREVASAEELEESSQEGNEDGSEDRKTEPVQATVEIKDVDGTKTIKLVLTLEISFPT